MRGCHRHFCDVRLRIIVLGLTRRSTCVSVCVQAVGKMEVRHMHTYALVSNDTPPVLHV